MKKLAVFVSSTGSLLQAILDQNVPVSLVLADRRCKALEIAQNNNVKAALLERTDFTSSFDNNTYTEQAVSVLENNNIEFIAMAGFMTILGRAIFVKYNKKILNTHPSLLPKFKGAHAVLDALEAKVGVTGFTVHYATLELDDGPIVIQAEVPIFDGDTVESLHKRIKVEEQKLYPSVILQEMSKPL